jgi:hypothetical protein
LGLGRGGRKANGEDGKKRRVKNRRRSRSI